MWLINDKKRTRGSRGGGKYITVRMENKRIRISTMLARYLNWKNQESIDIFVNTEKIVLKRDYSEQNGFPFRNTERDPSLCLNSLQVAEALKYYGWTSGRYDVKVESFDKNNFHVICYKTALKKD